MLCCNIIWQRISDIQRSAEVSSITIKSETIRNVSKAKEQPFWIWDQKQHKQEDIRTGEDCCFNYGIGPAEELIDLRVILNRFLVDKQAHKKIPSLESRAPKLWDKNDLMYKYKQKGKEDR